MALRLPSSSIWSRLRLFALPSCPSRPPSTPPFGHTWAYLDYFDFCRVIGVSRTAALHCLPIKKAMDGIARGGTPPEGDPYVHLFSSPSPLTRSSLLAAPSHIQGDSKRSAPSPPPSPPPPHRPRIASGLSLHTTPSSAHMLQTVQTSTLPSPPLSHSVADSVTSTDLLLHSTPSSAHMLQAAQFCSSPPHPATSRTAIPSDYRYMFRSV